MAGAGLEVRLDAEYRNILRALERATRPDLQGVAAFAGQELEKVTKEAFAVKKADPATGKAWEPVKNPPAKGTTLWRSGRLQDSVTSVGLADGSAVIGSNVVYARIHQQGGVTGPHEIRPRQKKALRFNGRFAAKVKHPGSGIPARPYLGVPRGFDRRLLEDPAVQKLLGLAGGGA